MENAFWLMVFLGACSAMFLLASKLFSKLDKRSPTGSKIIFAALIVLVIVAFGVIFGFEGGLGSSDWADRARRP